MVLMRLPQHFIDLFRLSILGHIDLAFRCDKRNEGPITFLVFQSAADLRLPFGPDRRDYGGGPAIIQDVKHRA